MCLAHNRMILTFYLNGEQSGFESTGRAPWEFRQWVEASGLWGGEGSLQEPLQEQGIWGQLSFCQRGALLRDSQPRWGCSRERNRGQFCLHTPEGIKHQKQPLEIRISPPSCHSFSHASSLGAVLLELFSISFLHFPAVPARPLVLLQQSIFCALCQFYFFLDKFWNFEQIKNNFRVAQFA